MYDLSKMRSFSNACIIMYNMPKRRLPAQVISTLTEAIKRSYRIIEAWALLSSEHKFERITGNRFGSI